MLLSKLLEITPALTALSQTKLSAKVGYRIAKAINLVNPELMAYDAQRVKLAESLGKKSADGKVFEFIEIDPETKEVIRDNSKEWDAQLKAMGEEEVDIKLPTITPDDLGDVSIEPAHLAALDGIIIKEVP